MKRENKVPVTFKMDHDLAKKLVQITEKEPWTTKSWIINTAIREFIKKNYSGKKNV